MNYDSLGLLFPKKNNNSPLCIWIPPWILKSKVKSKYKVWGIFWRPKIRAGTDKYAANANLYLSQNFFKQFVYELKKTNLKKSNRGRLILLLEEFRRESDKIANVYLLLV